MAATGDLAVGRVQRSVFWSLISSLRSNRKQSTADLEARATSLIDSLAQQADEALKRNQLAAEAQITQQVGALREQTVSTVTTVEGKLTEIKSISR